ncbi:Peroxide stress-activated histidine kinase mak2 [Talaromyces islandicus]|uniref:histidine kinase n=1 Tax=Talaromyces islandicus TaxID=28573 RepID=A0A0U1MAG2_TALIS|nr:Peroxide stress-activated histidine kinase mak2 [Talaromyces islandicus]
MRRNQARLTPTKAPSSSTTTHPQGQGQPQSHSHSRNPSRADPLSSTAAVVDNLAIRGARKDLSQTSPHIADQAPDLTHYIDSDARTLEDLRRRMEQTLVNQQARHLHASANTNPGHSLQPGLSTPTPLAMIHPETPSLDQIRSPLYAGSNSSDATIQGAAPVEKKPDSGLPTTPSYPFPLMATTSNPTRSKSSRLSSESRTRPSKAPGTITMGPPRTMAPANHASVPPVGEQMVPDDSEYPSPNLYDIILALNSAPGLDSWWANVIDILQSHFGVERASLAVPGDPTDLENVPWGQKATFNPYEARDDTDQLPSEREGAPAENINKEDSSQKKESQDQLTTGASKHTSSRRPSLLARHSFAGFTKDKKAYALRTADKLTRDKISTEFPCNLSSDSKSVGTGTESGTSSQKASAEDSAKATLPQQGTGLKCSSLTPVFTTARDLETETDPLIKCTGVLKLFGRNKPVVLTREYAYEPTAIFPPDVAAGIPSPNETVQVTPAVDPPKVPVETALPKGDIKAAAPPSRHGRSSSSTAHIPALPNKKDLLHHPAIPQYEDYEQNPPSPWSQSPAPSPAPRTHPDHNPFFTNHTVDEEAFAQNPPPHDYSQAKFVNAIGLDRSKTIVHVPLLHVTTTRDFSEETLRFPMAVISFVSPLIPYPANLRTSLLYLIPHLTTSYSLAHQYTQLERQLAPGSYKPRFGHILGLGGTFSDASSELELVAGLSGQTMTDGGSATSARGSLCSPDEISDNSKVSPSMSIAGTPGLEFASMGSASEPSATPGLRYSSDHAESYFNLQARGSAAPKHRGSKIKPGVSPSVPTSPGVPRPRSIREMESLVKDSSATEQHDHVRSNFTSTPTRNPSRNPSTTSVIAQLQRDGHSISEHVFQLMLNSVPLHLFLAKSQTGEVIWTNSKFDAYRRSQHQDLSIRDPWQNIHPSELESISTKWAKALQTGAQFTERVQVKRFSDDSAYRWFIFRANPLLSQTGQVVSWIGSFLDIHEQHVSELTAAQERETIATNAKYRALANSIPQVVFEATERRGLISANEQWQIYTGQSIEEAMNFGFIAHVHRDDLEKCGVLSSEATDLKPNRAEDSDAVLSPELGGVAAPKLFSKGVTPALNELVNQGIVAAQKDENGRIFYTTELRLRSKGGDYRWHLVRLIKVETANFSDDEASWYGTCTDINDRKNLERELNRAMLKLNKEMESKSKFFSNMSHEIRTPLNGILGTIPFILDTQLDNEQRRMLDTIQNSSTNLRELVDNILDVSRVEAGKMSLVNSWFHVRSVVEDVIDTISSRAIDKGLEINYLMDIDVPAMVIGDKFRIRQVLINLMGNAVKFTSQGEIYTRCSLRQEPSISLKKTELLLNFEVVDTGKGFSATDAERLMQRFSQLGGTGSQQHAGSGLGLFLSKQLVEMHGGKLTPSSREGQGARFSFYVKADAPPYVQEDPALTRQPSDLSVLTKGNQDRAPLSASHSSDSKILTLQDLSPMHDPSSPAEISSSSVPSLRSVSNYRSSSSVSSAAHTPEFMAAEVSSKSGPSSALSGDQPTSTSETIVRPSLIEDQRLGSKYPPPLIYSVLILCPLDHAREAVKQHIEQVIPLEVPATTTALSDIDDWKDLKGTSDSLNFSHIVLDFSSSDEALEVLQHIQSLSARFKPSVVIICDLYQKRQIHNNINELVAAGFKVNTVPKPVKPSAFSSIFDPDSRRDLSKDRNQDKAREVNNNFKTMSKMVKEVIGNKGYRILLVEDDETNRMVMLKYLDKVKVVSETASNGQECVDMVFSHEPGYYSLIICDIQMPIKNGYETCREIRAWEAKNHFPHIPIMALSANAMTDQIDNATRAGFNDYVTKPIKHNELGKMMMTLLDPNMPQALLRDRKDLRQPRP